MSQDFSLTTWLLRLPLAASCIDGDGRYDCCDGSHQQRYYALAEDRKGSLCPYPKLPEWCRGIFDARVRAAYWWSAHYRDWQLRAEHLMLSWRWKERNRRRVVLTMRRIDKLFYCRRRGYSWHFRCSLCGAISFFDLAGSRWACKKCGRLNPDDSPKRPRVSLLHALDRWQKLCAKIDARPKWVCCRWCGATETTNSQRMLGSTTHDLTTGKDLATTWRCFPCYQPESKITEYLDHRWGSHTDESVGRIMARWRKTGKLPAVIEKHYEDSIPF